MANTAKYGAALLGAAETNLQAPTATSVVLVADTDDVKISDIVIHATDTDLVPTTVVGEVYFFMTDGTKYHLFDTKLVGAITPNTTTVAPFRSEYLYSNLVLPTGWSLAAAQSVAGNANVLKVEAFGTTDF